MTRTGPQLVPLDRRLPLENLIEAWYLDQVRDRREKSGFDLALRVSAAEFPPSKKMADHTASISIIIRRTRSPRRSKGPRL